MRCAWTWGANLAEHHQHMQNSTHNYTAPSPMLTTCLWAMKTMPPRLESQASMASTRRGWQHPWLVCLPSPPCPTCTETAPCAAHAPPSGLRVFHSNMMPLASTPPDPMTGHLHHLAPPSPMKNFLISPPGLPPIGCAPVREEPPNVMPLAMMATCHRQPSWCWRRNSGCLARACCMVR